MAQYTDLDISFRKHPGTKDVLKTYDVEAVKVAIRNIFLYNKFEKPFDPLFGMDIKHYLFEDFSVLTKPILQRNLQNQIDQYESRVVIDDIILQSSSDSNSVHVEIQFHAIGFLTQNSVSIVVERTR